MAKELLLYSGIYSFVAEELITAMNDNAGSPIVLRVNSGGGDVHATWGIIAKMVEHGDVTIKVDGAAMSSAANLLMYANKVEALDVSNFVLHRADGYVSNPEDQAFLDKVNKDLRAKMTAKIDAAKFEEITGHTIDQLFNPETRLNVFLTAKQMKDIGVVSKVRKLEPAEIKAFNEQMRIAAEHKPEPDSKPSVMNTLAELKEKHPGIYAQAVAEGVKEGIKAEKDRIGAAMVFAHLDLTEVKKIIASGEAMTATQMAEFSLKQMNPEALKKLEAESQKDTKTEEVPVPATEAAKKAAEIAEFEKDIRANAGLAEKVKADKSIVFVGDNK